MIEALKSEYFVRYKKPIPNDVSTEVIIIPTTSIFVPDRQVLVVSTSYELEPDKQNHKSFIGEGAIQHHEEIIAMLNRAWVCPIDTPISLDENFIDWAYALHRANNPSDQIRELFRYAQKNLPTGAYHFP